jgi:hypothetical protein
MAKVIITRSLLDEIKRKFKEESREIIDLLETLKDNPKKGKTLGNVGKAVIKELKFKNFRFYFVTDGYKVKVLQVSELKDLIIKFVRMSNKKDQQKTIEEIKNVLRKLGGDGF